MAVSEFELFHGVVLTKLMRRERPVALTLIETKPGEAWSAYRVNEALVLFVKHRTGFTSLARGGKSWNFVFSPDQLRQIRRSLRARPVWIALVGGSRYIKEGMQVCLLDPDQFRDILDLASPDQQSLTIHHTPRARLRVFKNKRERLLVPQSRLDHWEVPGS